jgi:hypothetical protein
VLTGGVCGDGQGFFLGLEWDWLEDPSLPPLSATDAPTPNTGPAPGRPDDE